MAQTVGLSQTSVRRIWHAHGLKPHPVGGFKLSNDKRFVEKVPDVVGLYLGCRRPSGLKFTKFSLIILLRSVSFI